MNLPLLESELVYMPRTARGPNALVQIEAEPRPLIPTRELQEGEQYRFHFDMKRCIGCKCCVVACNEQNGNPADINWRRVGEVEGGHFPLAQRFHLSMGCNHCVEPSCLNGCPVEAYTKDAKTGVVLHSADACIGCQYCTWNCSYGVPQYNAERGVVGKCDMCHNRLADDMAPACVSACPEGAIQIEIVNIAEWRKDYLSADAPGLPSADDSISTTRVTLPENLAPDTGRIDTHRIPLDHPHWPLVFVLVLTQLSVGAFGILWILDALGQDDSLVLSALASLALAAIALGAAPLHLGRPAFAWRALKGIRRSWLSREVAALSLFAGVASGFAGMLLLDLPGRPLMGLLTLLTGCLGVLCSARLYMVPARPAWNTNYTLGEFYATALLLGSLFVRVMNPEQPWVGVAVALGAGAQLLTQAMKFLIMSQSETFELRGSSSLLAGRVKRWFLGRLAILVALIAMGVLAAVNVEASLTWAIAALLVGIVGEVLGRWLFFVTVVPKNIAAAFTTAGRAA
jgi:formate dehydrogenase iron-sulfur subunit